MRNKVYQKFNGRCAYTGTKLQDDWQVDHLIPKARMGYWISTCDKSKGDIAKVYTGKRLVFNDMNDIGNLMPAQRIVNHYKRCLSLEEFRDWYLGGLHNRLKKLPKNPRTERSIRRKEYLLEVASLFGITENKPFSGVFYFEKVN